MSNNLVEQARNALDSLEHQTLLLNALSSLAVSTPPQDIQDLTLILQHFTSRLHDEFQSFHGLVAKGLLPLVADVKSVRLTTV